MAQKGKNITSWILVMLGLLIVFGTHTFLGIGIAMGQIELSGSVFSQHILVNLFAGVLILIGWVLQIDVKQTN